MYLSSVERERLERLARIEGTSQAEIIRRAITAYAPSRAGDRAFHVSGSFDGPGDSVADLTEEELLEGMAR